MASPGSGSSGGPSGKLKELLGRYVAFANRTFATEAAFYLTAQDMIAHSRSEPKIHDLFRAITTIHYLRYIEDEGIGPTTQFEVLARDFLGIFLSTDLEIDIPEPVYEENNEFITKLIEKYGLSGMTTAHKGRAIAPMENLYVFLGELRAHAYPTSRAWKKEIDIPSFIYETLTVLNDLIKAKIYQIVAPKVAALGRSSSIDQVKQTFNDRFEELLITQLMTDLTETQNGSEQEWERLSERVAQIFAFRENPDSIIDSRQEIVVAAGEESLEEWGRRMSDLGSRIQAGATWAKKKFSRRSGGGSP